MGSVLSRCPYCERTNVHAASATSDVVFSKANIPPIVYTSMGMCSDCSEITARFIAKGLAAFRAELTKLSTQRTAGERREMTAGMVSLEVEDFLKSLKRNG